MKTPEDVSLRDVEGADIAIFFEQQLDEEANRMAAFVGKDPRDRTVFDGRWKRILDSEDIVKKTILRGSDVAGYVSCYPNEGELEVTYWLGKAHWGKGVASAALAQFLGHVVRRPLRARVAKDNYGSLAVLKKCGFEIAGEEAGFAHGRGEETEEYLLRLGAAPG